MRHRLCPVMPQLHIEGERTTTMITGQSGPQLAVTTHDHETAGAEGIMQNVLRMLTRCGQVRGWPGLARGGVSGGFLACCWDRAGGCGSLDPCQVPLPSVPGSWPASLCMAPGR